MSEAEAAAYKPVVAHDKEKNYREFEIAHGFDIRTMSSGEALVKGSDTRDLRDPQQVGQALLTRPENTTILEIADLLDEMR